MDDFLELLSQLANADDDDLQQVATERLDIDPDENSRDEIIAEALRQHDELSGVAHALNNRGYAAGREEMQDRIEELETELSDREDRVEELQEELDSVDSDDERVEQLQGRIDELESERDEIQETLNERTSQIRERNREEAFNDFQSRLEEHFTHPKIARAYALEHRDRFEADEDGDVDVLQIGDDIPYDVRGDEDPTQRLVQDVLRDADDEDLSAETDVGGGSGSSGATQPSTDEIDEAIEQGKQEGQAQSNEGSLDKVFGSDE